jgi:hypothetical protein
MKSTLSDTQNADASSSLVPSNDVPRPGRVWIFHICALVALPSTAHALFGAYDPAILDSIDPKFAPVMNALRYFGLDCSTPGLTGTLSQQFYINQVGFSAWGVIFSVLVTLVQVFRGSITAANPEASIDRLMKRKSYSAKEAERELHGILLWMVVPGIALLTVLFLNGIYGWSPFHIRSGDWIYLVIFSVGAIYLTGALVPLLYIALGTWLLRDIRKLSKSLG